MSLRKRRSISFWRCCFLFFNTKFVPEKFFYSLRFGSPLLLLLISTTLAPSSVRAESALPTKVIKCLFIHWDDNPEEELFLRIGEEYHAIKFKGGSHGGNISLRRMANFEVFRKVENPVEGESIYELIGETAVPDDASKVLFLVIPPDGEDGQHRIFALNDSIEVFGRGAFRVVNLTQESISVEFLEKTQSVDVDEDVVMQTKVDKAGGLLPCVMRNPDGETIFGTRIFCQATGRDVVFLRPPLMVGRNKPRMKFVARLMGAALVEGKE